MNITDTRNIANGHLDLGLTDGDGRAVHLTLHGTPLDIRLTDDLLALCVWDADCDQPRAGVAVSYDDLVALAEGRMRLVTV